MKNFFSKNWKNILIGIGVITLVIDLIFVITTPATIPNDFLEYGPDVQTDIFDSVNNIDTNISGDEVVDTVANNTGVPYDIAKIILIFIVGFVIILIISNMMEGSSKDKKK